MSKNITLPKKVTTEQMSCLRCEHKWWGRLDINGVSTIPKNCPSCKSPYWDKPIQRKGVSESRKNTK